MEKENKKAITPLEYTVSFNVQTDIGECITKLSNVSANTDLDICYHELKSKINCDEFKLDLLIEELIQIRDNNNRRNYNSNIKQTIFKLGNIFEIPNSLQSNDYLHEVLAKSLSIEHHGNFYVSKVYEIMLHNKILTKNILFTIIFSAPSNDSNIFKMYLETNTITNASEKQFQRVSIKTYNLIKQEMLNKDKLYDKIYSAIKESIHTLFKI